MRKLCLFVFSLCLMFSAFALKPLKGEDLILVYPFDSITITEAFHFEVEVTQAVPEASFLYTHAEVGDKLQIYVGTLSFNNDGASAGNSKILIVADEDGADIIRWVINGTLLQINGFYLDQFSSHILVDPASGIRKDLTVPLMWVYTTYDTNLNEGYMKDNADVIYDSVDGTYQHEEGLSIVISVNTGA